MPLACFDFAGAPSDLGEWTRLTGGGSPMSFQYSSGYGGRPAGGSGSHPGGGVLGHSGSGAGPALS